MDIGVYWSANVLEHKLERLDDAGTPVLEEVWNCRRLPLGLGLDPAGDRLFVATAERWFGYFRLVPEVLFNPDDPGCSYTLIFDVRSWRRLLCQVSRTRFRGWTYKVPEEARREATTSS